MIQVLIAPLLAWFIAHSTKFLRRLKKDRKFDWSQWHKAGGMPSGHSATVSALSLAVFLDQGFTTLCAVTLVFSAVVLRDTMIRPDDQRHKFSEVCVGIVLGLTVSYLLHLII